ncbi:DUF6603 domain-containing protein [Spirillospora sp. NPDC050679]
MALTASQLQDLVRLDGTRLALPVAALGSAPADTDLAPFLPGGGVLTLTGAARTATAAGVEVTGTGQGGVLDGLAVTAAFTAGADDVAVTLTATAATDAPWSFLPAFPQLAGTIWEQCAFTRPTLSFDSTTAPDEAGQIPLDFTGTLLVTTDLLLLDLLFGGTDHRLTGVVSLLGAPDGVSVPMTAVPRILLQSSTAPGLDLGLISLTDRRYDLYAQPNYNSVTADFEVICRVVATTTVPFEIGGTAEAVTFFAEAAGWDAPVTLRAMVDDLAEMDLADVSSFAGQGGDGLTVPAELRIVSPIRLSSVTVQLRPDLSVGYVAVAMETQEQWTISEEFVLQCVDVLFQIDDPLGDPQLGCVVAGLVAFGEDGTLELGVDTADRTLVAALRRGDGPLYLREIYTDLTGQDAGHLPEAAVNRFELWGALPQGDRPYSFQGSLDLGAAWQITDRLTVTGVGIDIRKDTAVDFTAQATLAVAGLDLRLGAAYDTATGWTFEGGTAPDDTIPIGDLIAALAAEYGSITLPGPLAGLTVENLAARVSTGEGTLVATATAAFPVDTAQVTLTAAIDTAARTLVGVLTVEIPTVTEPGWDAIVFDFELHVAEDADATRWAASYVTEEGDPTPQVRELVAALSPTAAAYVPDGLVVAIKDIAVSGGTGGYLVLADLTATIDLARLPLVGPLLQGDQVMGFDPLRVIATSAALPAAEAAEIGALLPDAVAGPPAAGLAQGLAFDGRLRLGALEAPVTVAATPGQTAPAQTQTSDNVAWRTVQLSFGPLHIERVGLSYLNGRLAVLVDAALSVGGLTLALQGLSAGLELDDLAAVPSFALGGLGLDYAEGPVRISGAFLHDTLTYEGVTYPAFSGKATLTAETFSVGALGSYADLPSGPTLFVYAFLDYPLGGPAFFCVTGLAAGFGYNRRLVAPDVDRLTSFPLVAEAIGTEAPADLAGELQRLDAAIPASPGDYFLALGVRFTSFQMIDSFLLLTAGFGTRFELTVLGVSTLTLPAPDAGREPVTPIAEIQLALRATFAPDDGRIALLAQLTPNSYLLSKACRLTGGFAFTSWFAGEHAGDFVVTVGGYHPHFAVPAHYPAVPRLAFTWQVSAELTLKGSAYYALTPAALMAGGNLSATWDDGALSAWFDAALDFLIAWQPYHYEASLHVSVGARYTFDLFGKHTINVHVGTDVEFWGPEFGGKATLDLDIVSITIRFGDQSSGTAQPVPWSRFRTAQLPAADSLATVTLQAGGAGGGSGTDLGAVNPCDLRLATDVAIPSTGAQAGTRTLPGGVPFGVAPAGQAAGSFTSEQTITITRDGRPTEQDFVFTPITKDLPAALWGDDFAPGLGADVLVPGLLTGYTVTAPPPRDFADPAPVPLAALQEATALATEHDAFGWQAQPGFAPAPSQVLDLDSDAVSAVRAAVAGKLLPGAPLDLHGLSAADFLEAPEVARV